jgi:glucose-6-phosphate 1-dehydrogenase
LPDQFAILGSGRTALNDEEFRARMKESVTQQAAGSFSESKWAEFSMHLHYLPGHVEDDETIRLLSSRIEEFSLRNDKGAKEVIYYMAVPPDAMPEIVTRLKDGNMCREKFDARIIVEKPFGTNSHTALELNKLLRGAFDESRIYRMDHYLGKDPVQNIMFLRFTNPIFEQIWNTHFIHNVQITIAEDMGIGHRGEFYEQAGIVRDIVQNHALQLIGMIAMEAPIGFDADFIRDEKVKVFRSFRPMGPDYIDSNMVRGQYDSGMINGEAVAPYRAEDKVSASSLTPTFFAGKFYIDNLRWANVPFYVLTGKRLNKRVTEICLQFKALPIRLFGRTCDITEPNVLILTIQPDEKISLRFGVKYPYSTNQIYSVDMGFNYAEIFHKPIREAYGRLLLDCFRKDITLFVREDMVEAMWDIVDPIIERWMAIPPEEFPNYKAGSWGPAEADRLLKKDGHHWITR